MRAADPPVHYLVDTPKGRLTRLEKHLVAKPWQEVRPGVQVKLLVQEDELYVFAQSLDRVQGQRDYWSAFNRLVGDRAFDGPAQCRRSVARDP